MPPKHSKELSEEPEALAVIATLTDPKEILAFVKGDQRDAVLDAATARINELKVPVSAKQGRQTEPITQKTADFKGDGIQGTKSDGDGVALSSQPSAIKTSVTIGDVIKAKRAQGYTI